MKTKLMVFGLLMAIGQASFASDLPVDKKKQSSVLSRLGVGVPALALGSSLVFDVKIIKTFPCFFVVMSAFIVAEKGLEYITTKPEGKPDKAGSTDNLQSSNSMLNPMDFKSVNKDL